MKKSLEMKTRLISSKITKFTKRIRGSRSHNSSKFVIVEVCMYNVHTYMLLLIDCMQYVYYLFPVITSKNSEICVVFHRNQFVPALQINNNRGMAHRNHKDFVRSSRIKLNSQNRTWKPKPRKISFRLMQTS